MEDRCIPCARTREGGQILTFEAMITRSINLRGVPELLGNVKFRIDDTSIVGKTAVFESRFS